MADSQDFKDKARAGDYQGMRSAVTDAAEEARHKAQNAMSNAADQARQTTEGARSAMNDAAEQARQKAEELSRTARQKLEQSRGPAADMMDSTAERIRQTNMGPAANVAGGLHSAADYVRQNNFGDMFSDLGAVIRRNPAPTLIAAIAVGFILGSAMRRSD